MDKYIFLQGGNLYDYSYIINNLLNMDTNYENICSREFGDEIYITHEDIYLGLDEESVVNNDYGSLIDKISTYEENIEYMANFIDELIIENNKLTKEFKSINNTNTSKKDELINDLQNKNTETTRLFNELYEKAVSIALENEQLKSKLDDYTEEERITHCVLNGLDIMVADYNKVCQEKTKYKNALISLGYMI